MDIIMKKFYTETHKIMQDWCGDGCDQGKMCMDAPTISLGSNQNIGLHTGAHANVVLLTYLDMEKGIVPPKIRSNALRWITD